MSAARQRHLGQCGRVQAITDPDPAAGLLAAVDRCASILEAEDYQGAYDFTLQDPAGSWTLELLRTVIESYGDAEPTQRVTVNGRSTDITQRKEVDWWGGTDDLLPEVPHLPVGPRLTSQDGLSRSGRWPMGTVSSRTIGMAAGTAGVVAGLLLSSGASVPIGGRIQH